MKITRKLFILLLSLAGFNMPAAMAASEAVSDANWDKNQKNLRVVMAGDLNDMVDANGGKPQTQEKPNIVVFYADDLGYSDLGAYGAKYYTTPNIDRLASEGLKFTDAYANSPNCAPARGALYSGQYNGRTGMYNVGYAERGKGINRSLIPPPNRGDLPLNIKTFADALTGQGYNAVQFGKWHLGYTAKTLPPQRGFKTRYTSGPYAGSYMSEILYKPSRWAHFNDSKSMGAMGGAGSQKAEGGFQIIYGDMKDKRNNKKGDYTVVDDSLVQKGEYFSDYIDRKTPAMLADLKSQGKPFLLMMNHYLVHGPINAPEADIKPFRTRETDGNDKNPVFAAMVKKLDDSLGLLMQNLEKLDLLDNTLVVVYSDNGGVGGYKSLGINGASEHTGNDPLKGGKTMLYEGGIRVPLIMYWKGKIAPGQVTNEMVAGIDFFPTLLELAGTDKTSFENKHDQILDGESMVPLMSNADAKLDRETLAFHFPAYALGYWGKGKTKAYWRSTPVSVIRNRSHKLVEHFVGEKSPGDGSRLELYAIADDIGETKDISKENPELTRQLWQQLVQWRKQTGAKLPVKKTLDDKVYRQSGPLVVMALDDSLRHNFSFNKKGGVIIVGSDKVKGVSTKLATSMIIEKINGDLVLGLADFDRLVNKNLGKTVKVSTFISGKSKSFKVNFSDKSRPYRPDESMYNDFQEFLRVSVK